MGSERISYAMAPEWADRATNSIKENTMHRPGTIERAYQLARSGPCVNLDEIRSQLKREFHESVDSHLSSPSLGRHLRKLCVERNAAVSQPSNA
jgi:hypothetical protein